MNKKFWALVLVTLTSIILSGPVEAGTETVSTYHDNWVSSRTFADNTSVYVTAQVGALSGRVKETAYGTVTCPTNVNFPAQILISLNDLGIPPDLKVYDGIYTGLFIITSGTPTGESSFHIANGHKAIIDVDLDDDGSFGSANIYADYSSPRIINFEASPSVFSPYSSTGSKDTTTFSIESNEQGSYRLQIGDREIEEGELDEIGKATVKWNGYDNNGYSFDEGAHSVTLILYDNAENVTNGSVTIIIDSTPPRIVSFTVSDEYFSPHASPDSQDTTTFNFVVDERSGYQLRIDGNVPTGTGDASGIIDYSKYFIWDGGYGTGTPFGEGIHSAVLSIMDTAGNYTISEGLLVVIDNTPPLIISMTENTGGEVFYCDETIKFTMEAKDWIGRTEVLAEDGDPVYVSLDKSIDVPLQDSSEGRYIGRYTVVKTDFGTWSVKPYFTDRAGNPAPNNGVTTGIVRVDGRQPNPIDESRIIRVGMLTPEKKVLGEKEISTSTTTLSIYWKKDKLSTEDKIKIYDKNMEHIWVSAVNEGGSATISNANLYKGYPISDYGTVQLGTTSTIKDLCKKDDGIEFSLTAVKILDWLSTNQVTPSSESLVIRDSRITRGDLVVVYNGTHTWLLVASQDELVTISNAFIYWGPLVTNYSTLSGLNAGIVSLATGGEASIDIGVIHQGITLYDLEGYSLYSSTYHIREGDDTSDALIYGHFKYNQKMAENDNCTGYNNAYLVDNKIKVSIDATLPIISYYAISPIPFDPYQTPVIITYNIEEVEDVDIEIYRGETFIRALTPPTPQYGENRATSWDGKDEGENIVEDGVYQCRITGKDFAGNTATTQGKIVLSTVVIKVTNLVLSPNPFTPRPQIKGDIDFTIGFKVVLEDHFGKPPTDKQLNALNFELNYLGDFPYVLVNWEIYDVNGNLVEEENLMDLNSDFNTDPFPPYGTNYYYGLPNYGYPNESYTGRQIWRPTYPDKPDVVEDNKTNDWDILLPFWKDENNSYYVNFKVGMVDCDWSDGSYLVKTGAKLVGAYWAIAEGVLEDYCHEVPDFGHYNLQTDPLYPECAKIEVVNSPVPPQDSIPPEIKNTSPKSGEILDPNKPTEQVWKIWAQLSDLGSGIKFNADELGPGSTIRLKNSAGQEINGWQTNSKDTIYWHIGKQSNPAYLLDPDKYTIIINAIDNALNKTPEMLVTFTVKDTISPKIERPVPEANSTHAPNEISAVSVQISEKDTGKSGINWGKTTIFLFRGETDIPLTKSYTKFDDNMGELKGTCTPLTEPGTYRIHVIAYDNADMGTETDFQFFIRAGNASPSLEWVGTGTYTEDGLDPEEGTSGTTFIYRIKYKDPDEGGNPKIGYPKVHIIKGAIEIGSFTMGTESASIDYKEGVIYRYTTMLSIGEYSYWFEASDNGDLGTTTILKEGPIVFSLDKINVKILSPNTGAELTVGSTTSIEWQITGGTPSYTVAISYSINGGSYTLIGTPSQSVEGNSNISWTPPTIDVDPSTCKIMIIVRDNTGQTGSATSGNFYIRGLPTITILEPDRWEELTAGTSYNIEWNITNGQSPYLTIVEYSVAGGPYKFIGTATQETPYQKYTWQVPAEDCTEVKIILTVEDVNGRKSTKVSESFTIRPGLVVEVVAPREGEKLIGSLPYNVEWQIDGGSPPYMVKFYYLMQKGTYTWIGSTSQRERGAGDYIWNVPGTKTEGVKIRISAIDYGGRIGESISESFDISLIIPEICVYSYPNPAKSPENITFKYYLEETASGVIIDIYDITGKLIVTLSDKGNKERGWYTSQWSEGLKDIASGIYIYQLKAGKNKIVRNKLAIIQ